MELKEFLPGISLLGLERSAVHVIQLRTPEPAHRPKGPNEPNTMAIKQQLERLAEEKSTPCVTISLNTHRTYPDNTQDMILLKNLLKEAEDRVVNEFGKRPVASLLEKLSDVENDVAPRYNLDSLHIFLSNDTKEIIRST